MKVFVLAAAARGGCGIAALAEKVVAEIEDVASVTQYSELHGDIYVGRGPKWGRWNSVKACRDSETWSVYEREGTGSSVHLIISKHSIQKYQTLVLDSIVPSLFYPSLHLVFVHPCLLVES